VTFRTRLLLAFAVTAVLPLGILAVGIRREVGGRLTAQYQRRVTSLVEIIADDLQRQSDAVAARLAALRTTLPDDNRFRLGAVQGIAAERSYVLDYAGTAMRLAGLALLQIQDSTSRIVSSGHFRNEFDRLDPAVTHGLATTGDRAALVRGRTPEGTFLALAREDSAAVGARRFVLVGGVLVDSLFLAGLARDPAVGVVLELPDTTLAGSAPVAGPTLMDTLLVPFVDPEDGVISARLLVAYPLAPLATLRASVDRWFLTALGVTAAVVLALAAWLAARISQPLKALASAAAAADLERGDAQFASERRDEIGTLARLLDRMVHRLRSDAARLRDVERRATLGELARQVNHDIRNGLAPIRNVFRHLTQVAEQEPGALPTVFAERRATVESGIAYLEGLAGNYAKLHPRLDLRRCDIGTVVREVAASLPAAAAAMTLATPAEPLLLRTDPLVVRRILENLARNAVESLGPDGGQVRLGVEAMAGGVRLRVADTGPGMTSEQLDRAFEAFYTTKPVGTGLGLAIVRRLVADLGGALKVETAPGRGTAFVIELPEAPAEGVGS
jgi:signal transduction histidine kinase